MNLFANSVFLLWMPLALVLTNKGVNKYVFGGLRGRLQEKSQRLGDKLKKCYDDGEDEGALDAQKQLLWVYVKMVGVSLAGAGVMVAVFFYPYSYITSVFDVAYGFWKLVAGSVFWSVFFAWLYE